MVTLFSEVESALKELNLPLFTSPLAESRIVKLDRVKPRERERLGVRAEESLSSEDVLW